MKIFILLVFCITLVFGEKILTIASYNVENLFDLQRSGYEYEEFFPNTSSNWNAKNYKIKLQNIAKVIKDINADIIALQEVESLEALKDLRFTLKQNGLYYQYYSLADKKNTTVKVAILSKIPFIYSKEISVTSSLQYRNILETKFSVNNQDIHIFTNHWKAKNGGESMRIISAKALLNRIKQLGYDKNIILLGDFNSDYEEYKKFEKNRKLNDTHGKTAINHILKTIHQTQKTSNVKYEKDNFYNTWYDTEENDRYSYIYRGKKEALDNIIISQSLLNKKGMYYKQESIASFKPEYLFNGKQIYRWKMTKKKPQIHKGKGYSDHLPVVAQFIIAH
ncbi:endonuclease/exonuclease/phosphatase family protein [bacterium]|nr:endonuclease/exonuclease/phosphatase family protein [bacterium]MBU1993080.1 endonuclease/exonuclease/phosphatase family protein [bacterium]